MTTFLEVAALLQADLDPEQQAEDLSEQVALSPAWTEDANANTDTVRQTRSFFMV